MNKLNVYFDSNVLVDWIVDRQPFTQDAILIMALVEVNKITAVVSPLAVANAFFVIKKYTDKKTAIAFANDSLKTFEFIANDATALKRAITNPYKDFEDDIHFFSALSANAPIILTRNKKDFMTHEAIKVLSPEELPEELGFKQ